MTALKFLQIFVKFLHPCYNQWVNHTNWIINVSIRNDDSGIVTGEICSFICSMWFAVIWRQYCAFRRLLYRQFNNPMAQVPGVEKAQPLYRLGLQAGWWRVGIPIGTRNPSHLPKMFRPAVGHTQSRIQWLAVFFSGGKAAGAWRWPLTTNYCGYFRLDVPSCVQ